LKLLVTGASGFIGTHFVEHALIESPGASICNMDCGSPKLPSHAKFWVAGDILDRTWVSEVISSFQPTHLVHFAARTDMDGKTVQDYRVNVEGTSNIIDAILTTPSIERAIFTSTQYVVGPGPLATHVWEHRPHTVYGKSKCMMEDIVRNANLPFHWTIVRPTNVWGPWHPRYAQEIWQVLKGGYYFHPGGQGVFRAYGYVGNVVDQIWKVMQSDSAIIDKNAFYVGDPTDDILKWTTAFSLALTGKKPRIVPRFILRSLALAGDAVKATGASFPLFSSRYRSMTQDYRVIMEPTYNVIGRPRFSLEQGVQETLAWLKTQG
jgi:nucleoside-diphosphate-sugar epimerase